MKRTPACTIPDSFSSSRPSWCRRCASLAIAAVLAGCASSPEPRSIDYRPATPQEVETRQAVVQVISIALSLVATAAGAALFRR